MSRIARIRLSCMCDLLKTGKLKSSAPFRKRHFISAANQAQQRPQESLHDIFLCLYVTSQADATPYQSHTAPRKFHQFSFSASGRKRYVMKDHRAFRMIARASVVLLLTLGGFAQSSNENNARPLAVNQTEGFAQGQLLVFTYFQNFDCIHEPFEDLDHNGQVAAVDANEFQRPICTVGHGPTLDPTGRPIQNTLKLYVIAPFFGNDTNPNDAFTPALGQALLSLFGFIPEAFKAHPTVPVQCPEPGLPVTQHTGMPSTCTMHTNQTDLGP